MSEQEIRVIDVTGDAAEKENVLSAKIFPQEKDENGLLVMKDFPFLYVDDGKKIKILYTPFKEPCDMLPKVPAEILGEPEKFQREGGLFRCVRSFNQLIEKILIRDAELDDRFVEIIKILAMTQSSKKNPDIVKTYPLFSRKSEDEFQLDFYWQGTVQGTVPFDRDLYRSVAKDFKAMADNTTIDDWTVDSDWVDRMLDQSKH